MNAEPRKRPARTTARRVTAAALVALIASGSIAGAAHAATPAPLPGAVWMTDNEGSHLNQNIYETKSAVWLSGGPDNQGPLPDGSYFVRVTDPSGKQVLGTSGNLANPKPLTVTNHVPNNVQLSKVVAPLNTTEAGYLDTPNSGGEHKFWVSTAQHFTNSSTKTDNFTIKAAAPAATTGDNSVAAAGPAGSLGPAGPARPHR